MLNGLRTIYYFHHIEYLLPTLIFKSLMDFRIKQKVTIMVWYQEFIKMFYIWSWANNIIANKNVIETSRGNLSNPISTRNLRIAFLHYIFLCFHSQHTVHLHVGKGFEAYALFRLIFHELDIQLRTHTITCVWKLFLFKVKNYLSPKVLCIPVNWNGIQQHVFYNNHI